jgi:hypothetical protein
MRTYRGWNVIPFSKKIVLILWEGVALRASISSISNYKYVQSLGGIKDCVVQGTVSWRCFFTKPPNLFLGVF